MAQYYLIHRFHQADSLQYSNQPFSTENEATSRACSLIGAGKLGDFLIQDEEGRVIADDIEIKGRCKAALD
jgi:hypothetical protein